VNSAYAAEKLRNGIRNACADDIVEVLCEISAGPCDAAELIPLLEQVAAQDLYSYFDDNGAGGAPHPSGKPGSFRDWAISVIENIRENQKLESPSPIAKLLKSLETHEVQFALRELAETASTDETLLPILEKIAKKDKYDSYWYGTGYDPSPPMLGAAAQAAIGRIRKNISDRNARGAACQTCGKIQDVTTVNTGRDDHFAAPITLLKKHDLDRDDDLWECPRCGAFFHWHDDSSWTGSGNNDSEILTRMDSTDAGLLREIMHPAGGALGNSAALAARVPGLSEGARALAAILLQRRNQNS